MTDEGQPEFSAWEAELAQYLNQMADIFDAVPADADRRQATFVALAGIIERLDRRPMFRRIGQLNFVQAYFDFSGDIQRGRQHPWLSLGPFGGAQHQTRAEHRLHAGVLIAIEMLIDAAGNARGAKARAYEHVSAELAKGGHSMKVSSLRGLHTRYRNGELASARDVQMFLTTYWNPPLTGDAQPILCPHGFPLHHCPAGKDDRCSEIEKVAAFYIEDMFKNDLFLQTA